MANKLRSVLTMLGIVIGVGSVVPLVWWVPARNPRSPSQIFEHRPRMITVYSGSRNNSHPPGQAASHCALTYEEAKELRA